MGALRCFDARKINDSGIGRYIRLLLENLLLIDKDNEYLIVLPPSTNLALSAEDAARVHILSEGARNYSLRELTFLSYRLWRHRPYLVHEPHYAGPLIRPWKTVVTIQDIIHVKFPEYSRGLVRGAYVRAMLQRSLNSDRVIVSSESTRRDLIEDLRADPARIRVTPYAPDPIFQPPASLGDAERVAASLGLGREYLLSVGIWKPHKNLRVLLQAFSRIVTEGGWSGQLALVGRPDESEGGVRELVRRLGIDDRVVFTGFTSDSDLVALYGAAAALVHPSLYEGFGFTILEAMACGTPVIAVKSGSVPEVTGNAGILVDGSDQDLFGAIMTLLDDNELRIRLRLAGLDRAKSFSWEKTARATLAVYNEL